MGRPAEDPRVAPVEDNLLALLTGFAGAAGMRSEGRPDVTTWHSPVRHPLFNGVAGARFPDDEAEVRSGEVLGAYLLRGHPFLWWTTPSTTSPRLERALDRVGMRRAVSPGMHLDLASAPTPHPTPPGLVVRPARPDELDTAHDVFLTAFGVSRDLRPDFARLLAGPGEASQPVLALLDDEPVGGGTLFVTGRTAGLYDVAVLPGHRGRGLGTAVTAALVDAARDAGCTEAVLHATELGVGVYERLGFEPVCTISQHLWAPPG